ncbi:MAG TPA: hypothetical protein VKH46_03330 [Thermoanaerobaculia bacterium]|jgi:hypothetical protein|nr:hypothetical protein [Thermoanaerobaculia bacterium]
MKTKSLLLIGAAIGVCSLAGAQSDEPSRAVPDEGVPTQTTTTTTRTTYRGSIVRYEPGHQIVLREGGREVSFILTPNVELPSDVAVGREVTLTTEPGTTTVSRIVTNDTDAEGRPRQTTETRQMDEQGNMTTTRETTVYGTVSAYEPGRSITIEGHHGKKVTYIMTDESQAPSSIRIGKKVRIYTVPVRSSERPVVKRITVTETTNPPDQR